MGLFFPYIPKKYKYPVYDVIIADFAQLLQYLVKYRPKLTISPQKSSKYSPVVLFAREANDVSKIYCQIQEQTMKIYFKIEICNIARLHQPPDPLTLTAYPTSG